MFFLNRGARGIALALGLITLVIGLLFGISACGRSGFEDLGTLDNGDTGIDSDTPDTPDVPDVPPGSIVSITVEPASLKMPVGGVQNLTARALLTDGSTADVTFSASWTSNNPAVVGAAPGGAVTAFAGGTARIRATVGAIFGEADVIVSGSAITSVRVDPPFAELPVKGTAKFTATAFFADGSSSDVTFSAAWISSNVSVANVKGGFVVGNSAGKALITASFSGFSGTATVAVLEKTLKSVEVTPFSPTIGVLVTMKLTATALYTDGTTSDVTATSSWNSTDPKIVTVTATGVITGVSPGASIVSASFGGFSGTTAVTVTGAKLLGISVSPAAVTVAPGGSAKFTATANYSDGSAVDVTTTAIWKSTDDAIANVSLGNVKGVAVGTVTISASFGGASGTATVTVSPLKLVGVTCTPASVSLGKGATITLKATGTYEGGSTRDITADVTWSSDDSTIASVSNAAGSNGKVTPVALGTTAIRPKLGGFEDKCIVTVTTASIASIAITPSPLSMVQGTKTFAAARATYTDGTTLDVSTTCTWSTASAAVATVSNAAGSQGQVSAVGVGSTTLSCTQSGVTGSITMTVTGPTLEQVTVSPVAPTCRVGDTIFFQAFAISTGGTSSNVTFAATWTSDDVTVLSALPMPGRFKCNAKGTATVSAAYGGKTGTTPVTVTDATIVSIQVDPPAASLPVGTVQQYQAVAIYSDGSSTNVTFGSTFLSTDPSVASISTAGFTRGQATALKAGTTTIKATYGGVTGSTSLTVTSAVIVSISVSPPSRTVPTGFKYQYTAQAIYSDGTSKDVTFAATWTTSNGAVIAVSDGFGAKGQATTIGPGSASVFATYSGVKGTASVTVTSAKLTTVQITPFKPKLPVGFGIRLRATGLYDDGTTQDLTPFATWTSTNDSVASVSDAFGAKGTVTPSSAGTATIKANYSGVIGTDDVTVTSATLSSIDITPNPASVAVGSNTQLTATGTFSDGTTLDITVYVGWTSSDTSVADVSNAPGDKGDAYGFKAGTATITAQRGTIKGTVTLTAK